MPRTILTADADYYVATTGNDTNPGTLSQPWATLQHAANWIQGNIDLGAFVATVHVAAGTYDPVYIHNPFPYGDPQRPYGVLFSGDTTTPGNVVVTSNGCQAFNASFNAKFGVEGFKLTGSGGGLYASAGAVIYVKGPMDFGAISGPHYQIQANAGGRIIMSMASYTISGGASCHLYASSDSVIEIASSPTVTLSGPTPAFSSAFAYSSGNSTIAASGITFSGSASGNHFITSTGGGIITGDPSNPNYFPGNSGWSNGGWYA